MATSRVRFSAVFNQVIRRKRLEHGLSQEALSELAEIDRTYVGLLERGKRSAGLDVAKKLAAALDVTLAELIADAEREWQATPPAPAARRVARRSRAKR
jgi:transcriptional regulator with XRE-family HTH domain